MADLVRIYERARLWEFIPDFAKSPYRMNHFPSSVVVISYHEPDEPATIETFQDDDKASTFFYDSREKLVEMAGPWSIAHYRVGHFGREIPSIVSRAEVVVSARTGKVVDLSFPDAALVRGPVLGAPFKSWESMNISTFEKAYASWLVSCSPWSSDYYYVSKDHADEGGPYYSLDYSLEEDSP